MKTTFNYKYQENNSTYVLNGIMDKLFNPATDEAKSYLKNIVIKKDGKKVKLKLSKYNRDFDFLREMDKFKILSKLQNELVNMEMEIKGEELSFNSYEGELFATNNHTRSKIKTNFNDLLNIEIKNMLRANNVKVKSEFIYYQDFSSITVKYNGVDKIVNLDLLDTPVKSLNKHEKGMLNRFIQSNISSTELNLTIGGILNNSWFAKIESSGKDLSSIVKDLISKEIPEPKYKNDPVEIKGLFSSIEDGKTIQIYTANKRFKVKMSDIDGIEKGTDYYKRYVETVVNFFNTGKVNIRAISVYNNMITGNIYKRENGKEISLARVLVDKGLAIASNPRLKKAEDIANKNYEGIWVSVPNKTKKPKKSLFSIKK